jgi:hypothetical protein
LFQNSNPGPAEVCLNRSERPEFLSAEQANSERESNPGGFQQIEPACRDRSRRPWPPIPRFPGEPGTPGDVAGTVQEFTAILKRKFAQEIMNDATAFKKHVVRLIRRELPPRRGRPANPALDAAVRMIEQGKTFRDVLRLQVPNFEQMDTYGRYLAEKGLREAIARRRGQRAVRAKVESRLSNSAGQS